MKRRHLNELAHDVHCALVVAFIDSDRFVEIMDTAVLMEYCLEHVEGFDRERAYKLAYEQITKLEQMNVAEIGRKDNWKDTARFGTCLKQIGWLKDYLNELVFPA